MQCHIMLFVAQYTDIVIVSKKKIYKYFWFTIIGILQRAHKWFSLVRVPLKQTNDSMSIETHCN